jgi:TIR domain
LSELFLSYNSRDRPLVREVCARVKAAGVSTFFDREQLNVGRPWFDELQGGITGSAAVAVFVGANGLGVWQKRELALASDRQAQCERTGGRFPVIPVLLPGFARDDAPGFLLLNTAVDLSDWPDTGQEIVRLAAAVHGRPAVAQEPARSAVCPYRGLKAFREEDAPLFFGREHFAKKLLNKVRDLSRADHAGLPSLVVVAGISGSGKSSVVQAGLLPLLRREPPPRPTWESLTFTPDTRPFHRLAAAFVALWEQDRTKQLIDGEKLGNELAAGAASLDATISLALSELKGTDRLLIVIDQFEELFTRTPATERARFVDLLLASVVNRPVTILLTLRADFYASTIGLSRVVSDAVERGIVNIGAMTRDELGRAIEEPVLRVGRSLEAGLVKRMLDDVAGEPGNLPLLEFTLTDLWARMKSDRLTHEAYDEIGGIGKSIGNSAEELYGGLPKAEQAATLRAFSRLVHVSSANEEGTDTRQRVRLTELDQDTQGVAGRFVEARLLTTGRDEATNEQTVEVAHEALIRNWERLVKHVNENRRFLLFRQRLDYALAEWERTQRASGALLNRVALREAVQWRRQRSDLNPAEIDFIRRSAAAPSSAATIAAVMTVVALLIGFALYGWRSYTQTDRYQLGLIYDAAPDLVATSWRKRPEVVTRWAETLVLANRMDDAELAQATVEGQMTTLRVADVIVRALVQTGQTERARRRAVAASNLAEDVTGEKECATAFVILAGTFEALDDRDSALEAALDALRFANAPAEPVGTESLWTDTSIKARAAEIIAHFGQTKEALDALVERPPEYESNAVLSELARKLKPERLLDELSAAIDRLAVSGKRPIAPELKLDDERVNWLYTASVVLAEQGDRAAALVAARRARVTAKKIGQARARCLSLLAASDRLVALNEPAEAATALDEAKTAYEAIIPSRNNRRPVPALDDSAYLIGPLSRGLARTGRVTEALRFAGTQRSEQSVGETLHLIADELQSWKDVENALLLLRSHHVFPSRPNYSLGGLTDRIVEKDFVSQTQKLFLEDDVRTPARVSRGDVPREPDDVTFHDRICSGLAQSLARHNRAEKGLEIAVTIQDSTLKDEAMIEVAAGLASHRKVEEAEDVLKGVQHLNSLAQGRRKVAENLVSVGLYDDAFRFARKLDSDEASSSIVALVAKRRVDMGAILDARRTAQDCLSADRLDVYDAIVRRLAVRPVPTPSAKP